jgi:hypothetical protein
MKLNLKKVSYDNRLEAILTLIGGIFFYGIILYGILIQSRPKSNSIAIGFFALGTALLIIGVWQLRRKKATTVININGWLYNSFLKGNKYVFILLSGCRISLAGTCALIVLYFRHLSATFTWGEIAFLAILFIFLIILSGYVAYRKYKSMRFIE